MGRFSSVLRHRGVILIPGVLMLLGACAGEHPPRAAATPPAREAVAPQPGRDAAPAGKTSEAGAEPAPESTAGGGGESPGQIVPFSIHVNSMKLGDHLIVLTPEQDVWVPRYLLDQIGLKDVPPGVDVDGQEYSSLRSLAPDVSFKVGLDSGAVDITIDPERLPPQMLDLGASGKRKLHLSDENSAYLNYRIDQLVGDQHRFTVTTVPYELAIRLGGTLAYSSYVYTRNKEEVDGETVIEEQTTRQSTNLTWDLPDQQLRVVLGDVSANSGQLGGSAALGGLSISRAFGLDPYFVRFPELSITGSLDTPSEVEVFVDGRSVAREKLPPGPFVFNNLAGATGTGEATVVITDAFGRRRELSIPFFVSTTLLKPGLQEFSYNLGVRRKPLRREQEYSEPVFVALHRVGIFDFLTAGIRAEADERMRDGGLLLSLSLGRAGQIEIGSAFSRTIESRDAASPSSQQEQVDGRAGYVSYSLPGTYVSFSASAIKQTRNYANLSVAADADKSRINWTSTLGINLGILGTLGTTYSVDERYVEGTYTKQRANYTLRISDFMSLYLQGERAFTEKESEPQRVSEQVSAGIFVTFGGGHSATLSRTRDDTEQTDSFTLQRSAPPGTGFGYRMYGQQITAIPPPGGFVGEKPEPVRTGSAFVEYRGTHGIYSVDRSQTEQAGTTSYSLASALSYVGGSVNLSRPINDAFAVVRLPNLEGVRVYFSNQEMGTTDSDGELIIPGLNSYADNRISFEEKDIPIDYSFKTLSQEVAPPSRGGALVQFDFVRTQSFAGFFYFSKGGKRTPAEYGGLSFRVKGRERSFLGGRDGEYYFENIPPGVYPARLFTDKQECRFDFRVPDSAESFVDLGEVVCEIK